MTSDLTKEEKSWATRLQKLLDQCPSNRFSSYTVGDHFIVLYDINKEPQINDLMESTNYDFCCAVDRTGAELVKITFPFEVASTSG